MQRTISSRLATPSEPMSSTRPTNGLMYRAPARAARSACGAEKTSVIFTATPSSASVFVAARLSAPIGSLTTMLGASPASLLPSSTIPCVVVAVDSAETGRPSQISHIFTMCCSKSASFPPVFAYRLGLVVTPDRAPQLIASRMSSRSAVSIKNFIRVSSSSSGVAARSMSRTHGRRASRENGTHPGKVRAAPLYYAPGFAPKAKRPLPSRTSIMTLAEFAPAASADRRRPPGGRITRP